MPKSPKYDIHPDFNVPVAMPLNPLVIRLGGITPRIFSWLARPDPGLSYRHVRISSFDGASIPLEIAGPPSLAPTAPCLLYFHGGAFVLGGAPRNKSVVFGLAKQVGCQVIVVDYRLAGQHPYPAGVEDCYAALTWAYAHAPELGIDPQRLAVYGESAGGALSAAVAQMARDRGGPPLCLQMLIYPVTDSSQSTESARAFNDTPVWQSGSNAKMWQVYLRNCPPPYPAYASPLNAASLAGLPPAYLETAEFDPLRDEGLAYAHRLQAAGVPVELNETKRTVHGFDMIKTNAIVQACLRQRAQALAQAFQPIA